LTRAAEGEEKWDREEDKREAEVEEEPIRDMKGLDRNFQRGIFMNDGQVEGEGRES
jgi:hypothetical protein